MTDATPTINNAFLSFWIFAASSENTGFLKLCGGGGAMSANLIRRCVY
jgi:hypothetical protein